MNSKHISALVIGFTYRKNVVINNFVNEIKFQLNILERFFCFYKMLQLLKQTFVCNNTFPPTYLSVSEESKEQLQFLH